MKSSLLTMDIILSKEIRFLIQQNHYHTGDKLPSERELAEHFGVQRLTIRSALKLLLQDRIIIARPKSGYYVAPERIIQYTNHFSMSDDTISQSLAAQLIKFKKLHADVHLSSKMMVPEGSDIFQITKLCYDGSTPICLEHSYITCSLFPELTKSHAASASILTLLFKEKQICVSKSNQKITLVYANEPESALLHIPLGTPLMKYKGLTYDSHGQLITFFENIMLIDRFSFVRTKSK